MILNYFMFEVASFVIQVGCFAGAINLVNSKNPKCGLLAKSIILAIVFRVFVNSCNL